MPRTHILLLFILAFTGVQARTTLEKSQLELADPFILYHDGLYYAYGTIRANEEGRRESGATA